MTDPIRNAGRRGLKLSPETPDLYLHHFRTTAPSVPPPSGDVTHGITDWGTDHNDIYSCCGPAATDHYQVAKSGNTLLIDKLGNVGVLPLYFEYGKSQGEPGGRPDEGVDNASWLKFLFDKGIIEAFGRLNQNDADEVHQAMLDFSGVLIAVSLTDDAEQLFTEHKPWTTAQGEKPDENEGHDILLVKYDENGDTFVTWGGLEASTIGWDHSCIGEAWVIVTSQDATRAGVDIDALKAKCAAFGGTA